MATTKGTTSQVLKELKLPPPPTYNGTPETWEEWSWRFKNYFQLVDSRYDALFTAAEEWEGTLSNADLTQLVGEEVDTSRVELSSVLYYALTQFSTGPALQVVRQVTSKVGLEAWRRLHERFNLTRLSKGLSRLTKLLQPNFRQAHFESDFTQWEVELEHYVRDSGAALPDSVLIAVLINATSGALQNHLRLNSSQLDSYQKVRALILDYFKTRHMFQGPTDDTSSPMEIDALWRRHFGKGKPKGHYGKADLDDRNQNHKGYNQHFKGKSNHFQKGDHSKGTSFGKGTQRNFHKGHFSKGKNTKGLKGKKGKGPSTVAHFDDDYNEQSHDDGNYWYYADEPDTQTWETQGGSTSSTAPPPTSSTSHAGAADAAAVRPTVWGQSFSKCLPFSGREQCVVASVHKGSDS